MPATEGHYFHSSTGVQGVQEHAVGASGPFVSVLGCGCCLNLSAGRTVMDLCPRAVFCLSCCESVCCGCKASPAVTSEPNVIILNVLKPF